MTNRKNSTGMTLIASCVIAVLLTGCGGPRVRTIQLMPSASQKPTYAITGVTSAGETDLSDTVQYIERGIQQACPAGGRIIKKTAEPTYNGFGEQGLYWQATVECNE